MTTNDTTSDDARSQTPVTIITNSARFALGQVVATPGALALLQASGRSAASLLARHMHGDFGDTCRDDSALNELAITDGSRIRVKYDTNNDWVTGFQDRDNCREDYTYEIDPKDTKGHFWSTVAKICGKHVVACSRYEFFFRRNQTGDYELEKVETTELSFPAKAERSERAASSGLPKECKRD